mgnify:CR=1 FL=1
MNPYDAGLIGNCQSAALVGRDSTVGFLCLPTFESPTVFGAVLDEGAGHLRVRAENARPVAQKYLPLTNVLVTTFEGADCAFDVVDWMPRWSDGSGWVHPPVVHRLLRRTRGEPRIVVEIAPRPDYGRHAPQPVNLGRMLRFEGGGDTFFVQSNFPMSRLVEGQTMVLGREAAITFSYGEPVDGWSLETVRDDLRRTTRYWEGFSRHCYLPLDWQDAIVRSALTLKLLTFEDTGAVIAAPTTSLPETKGGVRNWDYRYCWLRDSFFVVQALAKLSHFEEQDRYVRYLEQLPIRGHRLQPVYGITGRSALVEETLHHLRGAFGSRPVRIGNQAYEHQQNDVYGELVLTLAPIFFDVRFGDGRARSTVVHLVEHLADEVMGIWREPDAGIWEYRDQSSHYVFSKLMCWVALDRAATVARALGEEAKARRWYDESLVIRQDIEKNGWSEKHQAFVGAYGGETFDAANLLLGHTGFLKPEDPRFVSTLAAIEKHLVVDGLAFRYRHLDDFGSPEATFSICTFWYVDALRLAGRRREARAVLSNMLGLANHVGLFSEGIHATTKEMTGNFPQGYTHVAVINSAMMLSRPWGDLGAMPWGIEGESP